MKRLNVIILMLFVITVCLEAQSDTTLRYFAGQRGRYIGACVRNDFFKFDTTNVYIQTLRREFNILVAENKMKFGPIEPSPGVFDFAGPDSMIDFAKANNMQVRGHCLIWHNLLPQWFESGKFTRDSLLKIMERHITAVVSHFKGKVREWDVVNEAIEWDGSGLRNSKWKTTIGPDYIDSAFVYAHRADPDALLFYNDFDTEDLGKKSDAVYQLVSDMRKRGIPIDGVGLQCHFYSNSTYYSDIDSNIQRLAALGLEVNITELDISIPKRPSLITDSDFYQQALQYGMMMHIFLKNSNCKSFLMWGFTDKHSYLGKACNALIFDTSYNAKPAYFALRDTLAGIKDTSNKYIQVSSIDVKSKNDTTVISNPGGSLSLVPNILPQNSSYKAVRWSVIPLTGDATINTIGVVIAKSDGLVKVRATAQDFSEVYGEIEVEIKNQTSKVEDVQHRKINIYPDPAVNVINIKNAGNYRHYKIISTDGKIADEGTISGEWMKIDISNLQKGIYIFSAYGTKEKANIVFIKQ